MILSEVFRIKKIFLFLFTFILMFQVANAFDVTFKSLRMGQEDQNIGISLVLDNDGKEIKRSKVSIFIPDLELRSAKKVRNLDNNHKVDFNFVSSDYESGYYVAKVVYYVDGYRKVKHREILI